MRTQLFKYINNAYGDKAQFVLDELCQLGLNVDRRNPQKNNKSGREWYKNIRLYSIYPDGIIYDKEKSPLNNLTHHLEKIKDLGCNAVHVLPFFPSPMIDNGFDISDYYSVRSELGTTDELYKLIDRAKELKLELFIDLVFNHISSQHEWFQKAIEGDDHYREYFIYSKEKPNFIKKFYSRSAI